MDEHPQPPNVLAYQATSHGTGGRRLWITALVCAGVSLLVGVAQAWFALSIVVRMLLAAGGPLSADEEALFWLPVMTAAAAAGVLATAAAVMLIARKGLRFVPVAFTVAAGVDLLLAGGFMGLCVVERHATGLDQIVVGIGLVLAAAASVSTWLYAATAAAALRHRRQQDPSAAGATPLLRRWIVGLAVAPLVLAISALLLFNFLP